MNDHTRLIRVSTDLFEFVGTRADDGRKLTYEWGEAREHIAGEAIYEPVITATDDGTRLVTTERLAEAIRETGWPSHPHEAVDLTVAIMAQLKP